MQMSFVYILTGRSIGEYYIGYTKDLDRRLSEHRRTFPKSDIIYYEAYLRDEDARDRERRLKYYGSAWRALKVGLRGRGE